MTCEQVDRLVARAVQLLRVLRDASMQITPLLAEQARVRDVLHECVMEDERLAAAVEEAAGDELRDHAEVSADRGNQRPRRAAPDH